MDINESVMAASVYATPPPDLSSEDTALSDASNSSHISSTSSQHSKATKRSIASMLLSGNNGVNVNNNNTNLVTNSQIINTTITSSSSPSRPNSMSSNSPVDSSIDQSKKRRKQTTPIRISGVVTSTTATTTATTTVTTINTEQQQQQQPELEQKSSALINNQEITTSSEILNNIELIPKSPKSLTVDTNETPTTTTTTTTTATTDDNDNKNNKKNSEQNDKNQKQVENIECNSTNETIINKNSKENCDKSKDITIANCIEIKNSNIEIPTTTKTNLTNISKNVTNLKEVNSKLMNLNSTQSSIDDENQQNKSSFVEEKQISNFKNLRNEIESLKENYQTIIKTNDPDILIGNRNIGNIDYCEQCGEKFDSELKLSVHILQAHTIPKVHVIPKNNNNNNNHQEQKSNLNLENENSITTSLRSNTQNGLEITSVRIKLENSDSESDSENIGNNNNNNNNNNNSNKIKQMSSSIANSLNNNNDNNNINGNQSLPPSRPDEWLSSMSSLGFPFPPEAAAAFSASNYLSQLPLLGVPSVGAYNPVEGLSRPPLRIFNPEAYCDLCNKEFCNKYFLKTHKANKHGIYEPVTSSNESSSAASNQFNQISQVLQMQFHQQQQYEHQKQLQQQQQQQQQVQQSSIDISTQEQISQLQQQQQQQQHLGQQQTQSQKQQSSNNSTISQPPPQPLMPPEITVFCDICNKRFTNLFAMKRHRAKAHEVPRQTVSPISITTTTTTTTPTITNNNPTTTTTTIITANNSSSNNNNTTSPNTSSNLIKLDTGNKQNITTTTTTTSQHQPLSVLQQNQPHQQQPQIQNSSGSGSSEKDISSSSNNIIQQQNQQQLFRIPEGFKEDYTLEQEEVSFTPQPRKLSPSSVQQAREANFSYDKLKRLGVINPEAFCDLCCKEYCNKYFLRTHKLKRHGIFIPIDDLGPSSTNSIGGGGGTINCSTNSKENDKNIQQSPVWPPFVHQMQQQMQQMQMHMHQATPLNLMMAAAAAGVTSNVSEKVQRRPSEDSDDESNMNLGEANSFKKIRLDSILSRSDDDKHLSVDNNRSHVDNDEKIEKRNEKNFIGHLGEINNKSLDIPDNFTQLMQEGLVNAAAAAAFASAQDPDAVGLDIQKLQTMILQLNDLNGQKPVACNLCGKEMENHFHLQAHLAAEHIGNSSNEDNNILRNQIEAGLLPFKSHFGIPSQQSSPTNSNSPEICKQCDREFPGLMELKQHIIEYHGLMLNSPIREGFMTPERSIPGGGSLTAPSTPNQMDRKPLYTVTPTSSYCEICNKELCNKYFMKTHMQRMHGIEIENGAQIGGVVCNICNKELCSKYFLRVHKTNSHGIVDEGSPIPGPIPNKFDETTKNLFDTFDSKSGDLSDLGARYFTHYTEVCPLCNRRFRSSKWLRAHLMSDHGKLGVEKLQELAQSMIFSKPDSPTQLKIPNGSGSRSDGGNGNITPSSSVNNLLIGGLNNLDPTFLSKASPFPNMFMKSNNDEPSTSPSSTVNQSVRFQEYQCSMCPFTTPYYAFLFIHERSHTILNSNTAEQNSSGDGEKDHHHEPIDTSGVHDGEEKSNIRRENLKNTNIDQSEISSSSKNNESLQQQQQQEKQEQQKSSSKEIPPKPIQPQDENLNKNDIVMMENNSADVDKNSLLEIKIKTEEIESKSITESFQSPLKTDSTSLSETNNVNLKEISLQQNKQQQQQQPHILESKIDIQPSIETTVPIISAGIPVTSGIPNFNTLTHLANLLKRPASYAIPQDSSTGDCELMQSFLIEEKIFKNSSSTSSSSTSTSSISDEKPNNETTSTNEKDTDDKNVNRFVPAVIFLPVRERISNPITVSFTLTPA